MIRILFAVLALATPLLAISTISAKGSKFFTSDGAQFYIKGNTSHPNPYFQTLEFKANQSTRNCVSAINSRPACRYSAVQA